MERYGLLGEHLGHSYSPRIHSLLASYSYELFEKTPEELGDFVQNGDWKGINVTIPYKKTVIPFCSGLSERAEKIGAVNTLIRREDGSIFGDNTDAYGFEKLAEINGIEIKGRKCIVLGSGGASAMAVEVLKSKGAERVTVISRHGENNYGNLNLHTDTSLLVNTTPVGMYPNSGNMPVSKQVIDRCAGVFDAIYNPLHTKLIEAALANGAKAAGGMAMLVGQAAAAHEIWDGSQYNKDDIRQLIEDSAKEQQKHFA